MKRIALFAVLLLLAAFPVLASAAERKATPIPDELRKKYALDDFYQQIVYADGLLIVSSKKVPGQALLEAAYLIDRVLAGRDDLRKAIAKAQIRLVIMNHDEFTTDVPEHKRLAKHRYGKDWWDRRARGLGARGYRSAMSCGVENLLQYKGDPYHDENILIHEFAHVIDDVGLAAVDKTFETRLDTIYKQAMKEDLWKGGYGRTNRSEYWAELVQIWFFCNPPKARHDHTDINTRAELKKYDPRAYKLLEDVFGQNSYQYMFPKDRMEKQEVAHLQGWDYKKAPAFSWPKRLQNVNVRKKPGQDKAAPNNPKNKPKQDKPKQDKPKQDKPKQTSVSRACDCKAH